MMFEKSLEKNGSFAQSVTSSIAMGNISMDGTMTGETAKNAFAAYMGYDSGAMPHNTAPPSGPITSPTASGVNVTKTGTPGTVSAGGTGSVGGPPSAGTVNPTFSNIEIGGGRITGIETPPDSSTGMQFAMYSVDQYSQPSGDYSIVSAVDGSKWYKQYAKPVVDKTPYMADNGEIQYREKIIQRLPKAPPRKEKL